MPPTFRLPAQRRGQPLTFADLDALLHGQQFTFDDLAAALVLVVPPRTALDYLRSLSSRRALRAVSTRGDGTRELIFDPARAAIAVAA
jgi:hypothetical protein